MSSQKGNISRSRAPKHMNKFAFKNNLHDTSHTIKQINSLSISNVCAHCKGVIEWKIKYKKYKPLKAPSSCVKCHEKTVKHTYHTICLPCAGKAKVCPKCGKGDTVILTAESKADESFLHTTDIQLTIKALPERRRRTFNRFVQKTLSLGPEEFEEGETAQDVILEKLKEMSLSSGKTDDSFDDFNDDDDTDESNNEDE